MAPKYTQGSTSGDDQRVRHSVNWRGVGTAILLAAIAVAAFSHPSQVDRVIEKVYDEAVGTINYLEEVIFGDEETDANSSNNPPENTAENEADNTSTGEPEPTGENEAPQENTVTFRWTAYYQLVEENNGNHALEDLIMEFPAPTVTGKERYQPIIDQIAIEHFGKWWIYEDGELKWGSVDFSVKGVLSNPGRLGTRWVWSHGMSYSGYYNRTNGWKLLYSLFNKDVEFEVGMGFKARHVFQVPENIAGRVTIRDNPFSSEIEHSFNCRYDISGENTGDEIFAVKVGVELERITNSGPVMVENGYKKVVWKYRYEVIKRVELESLEE